MAEFVAAGLVRLVERGALGQHAHGMVVGEDDVAAILALAEKDADEMSRPALEVAIENGQLAIHAVGLADPDDVLDRGGGVVVDLRQTGDGLSARGLEGAAAGDGGGGARVGDRFNFEHDAREHIDGVPHAGNGDDLQVSGKRRQTAGHGRGNGVDFASGAGAAEDEPCGEGHDQGAGGEEDNKDDGEEDAGETVHQAENDGPPMIQPRAAALRGSRSGGSVGGRMVSRHGCRSRCGGSRI